MPILAILSRTPDGTATPVPVDDRRLEFRAIDGSDELTWGDREWIIQSGITGLSIPPREVITEDVPGLDGARLREVRTGIRNVVLPFFVASDDRDYRTHRDQMARVRRFCDYRSGPGADYAAAEGTFDLVAVAEGGERRLRCVYVDGMEGVAGVDDGNGAFYSTFDAKFQAVQPYWAGDEWSTPTVSTGGGGSYISNSDPWPRAIGASVALGQGMHVAVGGDVPSAPVIELSGPFTGARITSPQGLDVTVGAVASGLLRIDTGRARRVLLNGAPAWTLIGDSPRWRNLPPGDALINVVVTGATSDTAARVFGTSLWETAW